MKGRRFMVILLGSLITAMVVLPMRVEAGNFCGTSQFTDSPTVNTALGCVPVRVDQFMTWLLPFVFGIAGGISFLLMVYGFILMSTSGGDPKAVQGARETVTSAITGLLVSIFALFILRLLAVNILHIPGIN